MVTAIEVLVSEAEAAAALATTSAASSPAASAAAAADPIIKTDFDTGKTNLQTQSTMSTTEQVCPSQTTAASNSGEEDIIGALIYMESQRRKKEAAAAAAAARSGHSDTDVDTSDESTYNPKPDAVSSAVFHADTDVDTDDEGNTKMPSKARDEDSKSSSRKPAVKEEDIREVKEGETCGVVDRSSCTDEMQHPSMSTADQGEKKRVLQPNQSNSNKQVKKRQKIVDAFTIDLSDVPPQLPISKNADKVKEGGSKYAGAYFDKSKKNKWQAQIWIDGKKRHIGLYENEEDAAADFARALLKYRGQEALDKARKRNSSEPELLIDLSGVPPQSPIQRPANRIKEGSSKYKGVYFNKAMNKWQAQIWIDGKKRYIGYYENEEEAAVDYARAVFKYRG